MQLGQLGVWVAVQVFVLLIINEKSLVLSFKHDLQQVKKHPLICRGSC